MNREEMNIYQKMSEITSALQTVAKNLSVSTGKSSYRAVSEVDILNAVKPLEKEWGVYSFPTSREIVESKELEQIKKDYTVLSRYLRIKTVYRFVNLDNTSEFIDMVTYADGIDSGDKATGKAMTYGDKYALMKAYKISTGEDPDQKASEEYKPTDRGYPIRKETVDRITQAIADGVIDGFKVLDYYKVESLNDLTMQQGNEILKKVEKKSAE